MALVERLAILITGDASGAINEMKKVAGEAEKNAAKADGSASKFSGTATKISAGMIAAGAGVLSFAASAVSTTTDLGREVIKLQRYTGMTAESASKLAYSAKISGVDVDALALGLGKMSKQLDIDSPAFERLNVGTRDSHNQMRSMSAVLPEVADRFSKMQDGPEKTAIALQLFGKSGMNLMPFLNKGSEGMKALSDQAEKMGLVLSQDNVDQIKAHIRSQRELGAALDGVRNKIGLSMMPVMDAFTNVVKGIPGPIVEIIGPLTVFGGSALVAAGLIGMLITNISAIGPAIAAVGTFLEANPIALAFTAVAAAATLAFVAIKAFGDQSKVDQAAVDGFKDAVKASGVEADKLTDKQIAATIHQKGLDEVFSRAHVTQGAFTAAVRENGQALGDYIRMSNNLNVNNHLEKAKEMYDKLGPAAKKALDDIGNAFLRGDISLEESKKLTSQLGSLGDAFGAAATEGDTLATTEDSVASSAALAAEENARLVTSIQGVQDAMRAATDPVFAALSAQTALKTAQDEYNNVLKEHTANSPEAKEAYIKQVQAALSLNDALGKLAQSEITGSTTQEKFQQTMDLLKRFGIDPSSEAAQQLATDVGLVGYTALVAADTMQKSPLKVLTDDEQLKETIRLYHELETSMIATGQGGEGSSPFLRSHHRDASGNWVPNASGGFLPAGRMSLVGEHGPELFVPSSSGTVVNALSTEHAMKTGGGGVVIQNLHVALPNVTNGDQLVDELQRYIRRNGPLPLAVA
jgi:hypothetical protein